MNIIEKFGKLIRTFFGDKDIVVKPPKDYKPNVLNKKASEITVCWIDMNLFTDFAVQCAKQFKKSYYWTPALYHSFPDINDGLIGAGLEDEGLIRIRQLFARHEDNGYSYEDVDLFIFPDVNLGDLAYHLKYDCGKNVWGAGFGENIELYRRQYREMLKDVNLPYPPYKTIYGIDNLVNYLESVPEGEKKFVKFSMWRWLQETFPVDKFKEAKGVLERIKHLLGSAGNFFEFIVESEIKAEYEIGQDPYYINGELPDKIFYGVELKSEGYIGTWCDKTDLPKPMQEVNKKLSNFFKDVQYCGFASNEIRIDKNNRPYATDPCQRNGNPPNQLSSRVTSNWGEIMWQGSHGIMVQPIYKAKYGVILMIANMWANKEESIVTIKPKDKEWIQLIQYYKANGNYVLVPTKQELGNRAAFIAIGNSVEECIDKIKGLGKSISGYGFEINLHVLDNIEETVEKLYDNGIDF
jgi:hypothetical protein